MERCSVKGGAEVLVLVLPLAVDWCTEWHLIWPARCSRLEGYRYDQPISQSVAR